ncbi:Trypsin [Trichostrongylus colubriformis]|uniref:Trypsin n=1 Tax=Trichostrongylus colubriformis TaxID=6319 RepID=A0AAN8IIJ8_TRICO
MLFILVLPLLALTLDCQRITEVENDVIRKKCGVRSLKRKGHFKIFGGRGVRSGEYPWLVQIITSKHLGGIIFDDTCTGSLISPRHVLTAAHCVTNYDGNPAPCDGTERAFNYSIVKPQFLEVYPGTFCRHQEDCKNRQQVRKVIVHKNWKGCVPSSVFFGHELQVHDLAILELKKNISYEEAVPICLPSENLLLRHALHGAGSGRDSKSEDPGLKVATLTLYAEEPLSPIILTSSKDTSACGGDSGGPLFQLGPKGRFVIVGVLSVETFLSHGKYYEYHIME